MNVNWDEQYAQLEMDEAYDKYLDRCAILGIPPMPFGVWKPVAKALDLCRGLLYGLI